MTTLEQVLDRDDGSILGASCDPRLHSTRSSDGVCGPPASAFVIFLFPGPLIVGSADRLTADEAMPPDDLTERIVPIGVGGELVAALAVGLPAIDSGTGVRASKVFYDRDQPEVGRVAAGGALTDDVVERRNGGGYAPTVPKGFDKPSVENPMGHFHLPEEPDLPVTLGVEGGRPDPAPGGVVHLDLREESRKCSAVEVGNREKLRISHWAPPMPRGQGRDRVSAPSRPAHCNTGAAR